MNAADSAWGSEHFNEKPTIQPSPNSVSLLGTQVLCGLGEEAVAEKVGLKPSEEA